MRLTVQELKDLSVPDKEKISLIQQQKMCPHCFSQNLKKTATSKLVEFYHWEDEEYYYRREKTTQIHCKCGCVCVNGEWHIPESYTVTNKQWNTLMFINNVLGMDFEPLTKNYAKLVISQNMKKAVKVHKEDWYDEYPDWLDPQDFF